MQTTHYFKTLDVSDAEDELHSPPTFTPLFADNDKEDLSEPSDQTDSQWQPLFCVPRAAPENDQHDAEDEEDDDNDERDSDSSPEELLSQVSDVQERPPEESVPHSPPPNPQPKLDPMELERIREEARTEGYKEGYSSGEQAIKEEWESKVNRLEELLLAIGDTREALFQRVREDLVRILSAVPRKILRQVLRFETHAVKALVTSILEEIPRQERVVIKVSEDDLRFLEEAVPGIQRRLGGYTQIEIEPSRQVSKGGAILVIEGGEIDATIERQLETFDQKAREWLLGASDDDIESVGVRL